MFGHIVMKSSWPYYHENIWYILKLYVDELILVYIYSCNLTVEITFDRREYFNMFFFSLVFPLHLVWIVFVISLLEAEARKKVILDFVSFSLKLWLKLKFKTQRRKMSYCDDLIGVFVCFYTCAYSLLHRLLKISKKKKGFWCWL